MTARIATLAGWLLVGGYGYNVSIPTVYDTEKDCSIAAQYIPGTGHCVPDGAEVRSWQGVKP